MFASFRFTVEMAKRYNANVDRIIEQSVNTIRKIVETDKSDKWEIVLEHRSNTISNIK
jgi:CRISPR-associated endonuclease/helicase Cas3